MDPPWTARERVLIDKMEQYLKKRESIQVEVTELKHLLGPEDADVSIEAFVQSARDEGGRKKIALLDDEGKVEALRRLMQCYQWSRSSLDCTFWSGVPSAGKDRRQVSIVNP